MRLRLASIPRPTARPAQSPSRRRGQACGPAPVLLAVMALAGSVSVAFDRFNPDALRWSVAGGVLGPGRPTYLSYGHHQGSLGPPRLPVSIPVDSKN